MYCGLCHALAREYGFKARWLLGYDFVFLALALSVYGGPPEATRRRCPASPARKKACCLPCGAMDAAADLTILLSFHKLADTVDDDSALSGLGARMGMGLLRRSRRKAAARRPEAAGEVVRQLETLRVLERERTPALDPPADTFARLTACLGDAAEAEEERRVLRHLFYHLGRWIYLMDACDDLAEDVKKGRYNPVAARFGLADGTLTDAARTVLGETARLSRLEMEAAAALMPDTPATPIVENIICGGLPHVESLVLAGIWPKAGRRRIHEGSL